MYEPVLEALAQGATVVTANNRLSRTLRHHYDRQQSLAGRAAWQTPDILSWNRWLDRLWEESRLLGGAGQQLRVLDDAAASLLWQDSIAATEGEGAAAILPVQQLARSARNAWELVHEWQGLDAPEWTDAGLTPDQQAFLRWSANFRDRCAQHRLVSRAELCVLLRNDVEAGLFDRLGITAFVGFDEWSPGRQRLREALTERGVAVTVIAPADSAGLALPAVLASGADELLAAAQWARAKFEASNNSVIGVIVPDLANRADQVRRTFGDVFVPNWRVGGWPAELPLNISYGRPLAATPPVHAALTLFRVAAGRASFDELSLLLRSPWLRAGLTERAQRARLELRLRDRLRVEFRVSEALPDAQSCAPEFAALLAELNERSAGIRRLRLRSAAEWAHWLVELLQAAGWPGDEPPGSESWQIMQAWNALLGAFAGSGDERGAVSHADALRGLTQLAHERLFQPEGPGHGVQVMGTLEAAGHEFDSLWICGMARELWPGAAKPDALIPLALQRRLGMPDHSAAATLDYAGRLTRRMLASAPDVVVSWPAQQDGEQLAPTPLIGKLAGTTMDSPQRGRLWNRQMFGAAELEHLRDDPPPALDAASRTRGGSSVLNLQAISPLNAFIEKRLGAGELRQPPIGIDALRRGNITHAVLEFFYRRIPDRASLSALSTAELQNILIDALQSSLQQLPGMDDRFMQELAKLEMRHQLERLTAFLALDQQRPDFTVERVEESTDVAIGPLTLRLKLDRMDLLAGGGRFVIDYKTGAVNRQNWNPDSPRDLQLPLYVTAIVPDAVAVAFAQISVQGIAYDGVGQPSTGIDGIRSPGKRHSVEVRYQYPRSSDIIGSWDELRSEWKQLLEQLAVQFARGDFRFDPLNPDSARGQFAVLSRVYDDHDIPLLLEAEE